MSLLIQKIKKFKRRHQIKPYPKRRCLTLHECIVCGLIRYGDEYFDGGYGNRIHVKCYESLDNKLYCVASDIDKIYSFDGTSLTKLPI